MDPAHRGRDHRRRGRRLAGRHPHQVGAPALALMPVPGMDQVQAIVAMLSQLMGWLRPFVHLNLLVKVLLDDSIGLLLKVWFGLILHTTDFETGHDFTTNSTIQAFEPTVQLVADGALTLVVIWASYRVMWGHGLRSQYTARIMLPRLFMAAVLLNFSLPLV